MPQKVMVQGKEIDVDHVRNPHLRRILKRKGVMVRICPDLTGVADSKRFETDYGDHREKYHDQYHEHAQYIES